VLGNGDLWVLTAQGFELPAPFAQTGSHVQQNDLELLKFLGPCKTISNYFRPFLYDLLLAVDGLSEDGDHGLFSLD
jgi:hypothetical protein